MHVILFDPLFPHRHTLHHMATNLTSWQFTPTQQQSQMLFIPPPTYTSHLPQIIDQQPHSRSHFITPHIFTHSHKIHFPHPNHFFIHQLTSTTHKQTSLPYFTAIQSLPHQDTLFPTYPHPHLNAVTHSPTLPTKPTPTHSHPLPTLPIYTPTNSLQTHIHPHIPTPAYTPLAHPLSHQLTASPPANLFPHLPTVHPSTAHPLTTHPPTLPLAQTRAPA